MTLVDPRAGVVATFAALSEETGVHVDGPLVASRLGPPLEQELARWFPEPDVARAAERYRELFVPLAVPLTAALPGAAGAVRAVRASGAKAVVVTAKMHALAVASLAHVGIEVDAVVGWRHGTGKAEALREHAATVYVGDHVADVDGARAAGAVSVAVASGPCSAAELAAYGADVVLADLTAFPPWWRMNG
jgi:phosphoglycolate phosphatase-like HAD superfamily hydrolase